MTDPRNHYDRGLDYLARYLREQVESALSEATTSLRAAAAATSDSAHGWAALGYALDAAGESEEALASLQRAQALDPNDDVIEVFVLTLLSELGPEDEALAAVEGTAARMGIGLSSLRGELLEAGFPVDSESLLRNGFLHARNFLRSRLEDEIDESQRRRGGPASSFPDSDDEWADCTALRDELRSEFVAARVPADVRQAVPWAMRLGVGDDVCRTRLMRELSEVERAELLEVVRAHSAAIHAWLDDFGTNPMPVEAAACMYLLLAVEEVYETDA